MSNLRKEIERNFKKYEINGSQSSETDTPENISPELKDDTLEVVTVIQAPEGYSEKFAADFCNLSQEWQEYLSKREDELNKQIKEISEKLQQYTPLERVYQARSACLQKVGISHIQDWLLGLSVLDAAMDENPRKTLSLLASCYGCDGVGKASRCYENMPDDIIERLGRLERDYTDLVYYLRGKKDREQAELMRIFAAQKDECGQPQHPYFSEVVPQVLALLDNGTAFDVADAYEKAIWLNPFVREELIRKIISSQSTEAQKAKKASFAPKGKTEAPEKELSLREEIQKNMAAFLD